MRWEVPMARILVTSLPFAGHVGPTGALAAELVHRGHHVVAYTGRKYRDRFVAAGAQWLPWTRAQDFDDADLGATFPGLGDGKGLRGARANGDLILFGTASGQARDILAAAEREPFDLVVADQLGFGAGLAAEALAIPWASVAVTPLTMVSSRDLPPPGTPFPPGTGRLSRVRDALLRAAAGLAYRRLVDPRLNRIRAEVGLGRAALGAPDSLYSPRLLLAQGVPALEYPRTDLPGQVHFVGRLTPARRPDPAHQPPASRPDPPMPSPASRPDPAHRRPAWWSDLVAARTSGRPVVHITQGTLDVDLADLVRPAVAALAGAEALVVCTTGGVPRTRSGRCRRTSGRPRSCRTTCCCRWWT
ncbi:glycosyltransferase family protein [Micromonospora zhanjiangensis]